MGLNWSNALSTAGGAAAAVGLEGVRAQLDQQKIELADRLAGSREIAREERAPALARATTTATADATAESAIRNAPGLINAERQRIETLAPVKRREEIDSAIAKLKALSTPEMLEAERKIKLAGHIVDPAYTLVPQADGTVITFDTHSGTSKGALKDADGNAIVRKDPEEMRAAVSVINLANTNLKIAEAAYKADAASLEPGVKEKATVAWEAAQRDAKELTAPAYAVLYAKAKIPGVSDTPAPAGKTGWDSATGEVFKDGEVVGSAKSEKEARGLLSGGAKKPAVEKPAVEKPAQPGLLDSPSPIQQREAEMRKEYEAEQARKKAKDQKYLQDFQDGIERTRLRSGA